MPEIASPNSNTTRDGTAAADPTFLIMSALTARENAARDRGDLLSYEQARLVLVVDQLEELVTLDGVTQDLQNRFVLCLQALMRTGRVFVIATMRSDYWHRAAEIPRLVSLSDESGRFDLLPATQAEINEMIRRSAEAAGLTFETDPRSEIRLDASLAAEAASEPGTLPLLSFLLDSMFTGDIEQAKGSTLTYASMRALGGLKGAIASRAESALSALPLNIQNEFPKVLRALVRGPTRRRAPMALFPEGSPERSIIEALLSPNARLLIAEGNGEGAQVYLAHEALITHWERAKKQIEHDAADFRTLETVEQAEAEYRAVPPRDKHGYLLRDKKLMNAVDLEARWNDILSPEQKAFIDKSSKAATAAKLRRWAAAATVGVILAAIPVILIVLKIQREIEREFETARRYEIVAARGNDVLNNEDPNLALLLALEFLPATDEYAHPIEALAYKALQTPRPKAVLSAPAAFPTATFSPDGQLLLISRGNTFQVWKANDEIELVVKDFRPRGVSAGRRAVWSADGRWIVGATDDNRTALFAPCSVQVRALRKYFRECVNQNEDEVRIIGEKGTASYPSTLSPTSDRLLTSGSGQAPQLWDVGSNPAKPTFLFRDGPANFAITFNQQGDRLALGSVNGSVRIHETANPTEGFTLRPQARCGGGGENPPVQVFSVEFNPAKDKGDEMVSTTLDGCLRLWNVKEQRLIKDHNLGNTGFFFASFDPSGQRIAMTSDDGSVRVWEPDNADKPDMILRGHRGATWTVEFSRETGLLASASSESVRIWTLTPALHPSALPAAPDLFGAVRSFEPQGGALTLHIGERPGVTLDDPRSGQNVVAAAVSKDGNRVLVAEKEKTLKLYDLSASQAPLAKFEVPGVEWKAVGFLSKPDRMVGETTKGEFFAWPFFKDRTALIDFAKKSLPVDQNLKTIELSLADKCRFGVETKSPPC